jgi:16S rRNA G966 N2-methylase RsmD
MNPAAVKIIRENVQTCGFGEQTKILSMDARAFLAGCREKFDVIFLDPPYAGPLLEESLKTITAIDIVSEHGIIVCETMADRQLPTLEAPYEWGKDYRYGQIKLTIGRRQGSDPIR